jgi:hypothetical protein
MSDLGDWGPVLNGAVYKVFHDNGVPNADDLAEKCAEALQSVVTSIRLEQMEVVIDRLTGMAREQLLNGEIVGISYRFPSAASTKESPEAAS